jgi:hypothetical protein
MASSERGRKIINALLLMVGVEFWLIGSRGEWIGPASLWIIAATLAAALIPPVRRMTCRILDQIDQIASFRWRWLIAICIAAASTVYFLFNAWQQGIGFYLAQHDEFSYLIQTRTLLTGRLWLPQPPLADFFETFHLIVHPVYASKYFIGTALLCAPGLALGLPYWLLPAIVAGMSVGVVFLLISRLSTPSGGMLGAVMLIASYLLRRAATLYMSFAPILLLITLALVVFLHWQEQRQPRGKLIWGAVLGVIVSFAAITRPVDALCFGIPLAIGVLWHLMTLPDRTARILNFAVIGLAAAPLLVLQAIVNRGVTGSVFDTPWAFYARQNDPYDGFTMSLPHGDVKPQTSLPQKLDFMREHSIAAVRQRREPGFMHRWINEDFQSDMAAMFSHPLLLCLVPIGLMASFRRCRLVLVAGAPLVILAYTLFAFPDVSYILITAPAGAVLVVGAIEALMHAWPRKAPFIRAWMAPCIVGLCVSRLPQVARHQIDSLFQPRELKTINQALETLPHKPAVVLFRYTSGVNNPEVEPVYNFDVAWPEDAPVIRAQDLGERNHEIFEYFSERSPARTFYLYDRADGTLRELGSATELAGKAQP